MGTALPGTPAQCRLTEILPVFFTVFDLLGKELGNALPLGGLDCAAALPESPDQPQSRFGEAEGRAEVAVQCQGQEVPVDEIHADACKFRFLLRTGAGGQEGGRGGFPEGEKCLPFVREPFQFPGGGEQFPSVRFGEGGEGSGLCEGFPAERGSPAGSAR